MSKYYSKAAGWSAVVFTLDALLSDLSSAATLLPSFPCA